MNDLRNICAHHNRLWNTSLIVNKPMQAKAVSAEMTQTAQEKFYGRAIVLVSLLNRIEPTAEWKQRLMDMLAGYGTVPLAQMGFTHDWRSRPFWL
jgi:abortive infection bacteriophage resistance protein